MSGAVHMPVRDRVVILRPGVRTVDWLPHAPRLNAPESLAVFAKLSLRLLSRNTENFRLLSITVD